jgi:hypothetical protein
MPSFEAQKRNSKLTQFEELKDAVIANTVKNVPAMRKEKKQEENKSLSEFSAPTE